MYPAGPLIVAMGLGVMGPDGLGSELAILGLALLLLAWVVGVLWARLASKFDPPEPPTPGQVSSHQDPAQTLRAFAPFDLLAALPLTRSIVGVTGYGTPDFLFQPKGALLAEAISALLQTETDQRLAWGESAVRRTGSLLLVIGAASAFAVVLTGLVPIGDFVPVSSGIATLTGLFALTVVFKLIQSSSMATLAAVAPVTAPVVLASGVDPAAAVFAICLGSFIAVLPNDSYYWLVRRDAFSDEANDPQAVWLLAGGATLQALVGLSLVLPTVTLTA